MLDEFVKLWMLLPASGIRRAEASGCWPLREDVSDAIEKQELRRKYGADVVDMEGAAVAQVAREHGLEFAAVKSISDDASICDAAADALYRSRTEGSRRATFCYIVAFRPKWWPILGKMQGQCRTRVGEPVP